MICMLHQILLSILNGQGWSWRDVPHVRYDVKCVRGRVWGVWRYRVWKTHNTRQQDFGTWKVYCVCNVTFHAEFKYAIRIVPSPTVFVQWHFLLSIFRNFRYFLQWFFYTWNNILSCFEQRVVTDNLPLSNH